MFTDIPCRFVRFISIAAVIVAASGILGATGQPLYAAVGDATLQWATVKSEREKLRRRVTSALMVVANYRVERRDSARGTQSFGYRAASSRANIPTLNPCASTLAQGIICTWEEIA
jgi:hypothetical protein